MDMFSKAFFYPTLTTYLMQNFGLSIETSSIFFVLNMVSYFIMLQFIDNITQRLGLKLTVAVGLVSIFIGTLFLPPIPILPKSTVTIVIGLLILGIPSATIIIPAICDMIDNLKTKNNLNENVANDTASAIFNLALNFGEAIGPVFGGYVTEKQSFQASCVYTSLIALAYAIFFFFVNYDTILIELEECKKETHNKEEHNRDSLKSKLTSDEDDYKKIRMSRHSHGSKRSIVKFRALSYTSVASRKVSSVYNP